MLHWPFNMQLFHQAKLASKSGRILDLKKAFKPRDLDSRKTIEVIVRLGFEYKATCKVR